MDVSNGRTQTSRESAGRAVADEPPVLHGLARVRQLWRLWRNEREDPEPFYTVLAREAVADLDLRYGPLTGQTVLDMGCGPGFYTRAFRNAGAEVIPLDNSVEELELADLAPEGAIVGDARDLPLDDNSVEGVFSSNMLEHTPNAEAVLDEIERVLRPGGWAYVSWTNWFSPWGGHAISPYHYLGPRLGLRIYEWRHGPPRKNRPGEGLFPVHIGPTLEYLRRCQGVIIDSVEPRYWPRLAFITRVPLLREILTWNCVVRLRKSRAQEAASVTSERFRWEEIAREDPFWAVLSCPGQKYGRWDSESFFATGELEIAAVMSRAERLSHPRRRQTALDFGCGLGRLTRSLSRRFDTAVGLDISETMVRRARKLNADFPGCEFRANTWPDLRDFPDQSFDMVYSGRVLQHLPGLSDIKHYLVEFLRVVRDDGLIVFQLPHQLTPPVRLEPRRNLYLLLRGLGFSSSFLYWRLGLHPMRMTSVATSEVTRLLASCGGRVLDVERRKSPGYVRDSVYFVARAGAEQARVAACSQRPASAMPERNRMGRAG